MSFVWHMIDQTCIIDESNLDGIDVSQELVVVPEPVTDSVAVPAGAEGRHNDKVDDGWVNLFARWRFGDTPTIYPETLLTGICDVAETSASPLFVGLLAK